LINFLQTILAHGVHLEDSELTILKQRETAIIHCPSSNTNLKSGLCDVQRLKANNIKVGLGTGITKLLCKNFILRMIFYDM
jgi:guanine deaminase